MLINRAVIVFKYASSLGVWTALNVSDHDSTIFSSFDTLMKLVLRVLFFVAKLFELSTLSNFVLSFQVY